MAGYSGKPLLEKLGIKSGHRVSMPITPVPLPAELNGLKLDKHSESLDVILLFVESNAQFKNEFALWMRSIQPDGMIWVAWPKKSSGRISDLSDNVIRDHVLHTALVDVKVCALDDTWSGLKLVVRKELRSAWDTATK